MPRFGENMMEASFVREDVLKKVRKNRKKHAAIVEEARAGYLAIAKEAIAARMRDLESGRVVTLEFRLSPPIEHLDEYDTVIQMLEMAQDINIVLMADQFRQFVMDEWDWSDFFFASNKMYSTTANSIAAEKGL